MTHGDTDLCGCCEAPSTGPERANPPGQPAIAYRSGTWASFLERMVERLARHPVEGGDRPLARLSTRAQDDGGMALLDAFAVLGDVLTFYQERFANEGHLGTAKTRRSVLELARSIGYELRAGVAAGTHLAYTLDEADTSPDEVTLTAGSAVMSVPSPGKLPRTFETTEELTARPEWNAMRPVQDRRHPITVGTTSVWIRGIAHGLKPGDGILVVGAERRARPRRERWDFRILESVHLDRERGISRLDWEEGLGDVVGHRVRTRPAARDVEIYTFRARASLFGWNAPHWKAMTKEIREAYAGVGTTREQWPGFSLAYDPAVRNRAIDLDRDYPEVVAGSWVVLRGGAQVELYLVERVVPKSRADFTLTGKVTRLELDTKENLTTFGRRATVVHMASEELERVKAPYDPEDEDYAVQGREIELDAVGLPAIPEGRTLEVCGTPIDGEDPVVELAVVESVRATRSGRPVIRLTRDLAHRYRREHVTLNANVAAATDGAKVAEEKLGSGDAARAHQRLRVRNAPVTWISSPEPGGAEITLEIRVDGVRWSRVDSLYEAGPNDRVYIVRLDDEGNTWVQFGDGLRGARLPTGEENVVATYRKGNGLDGEVAAGALSLLQSRPLGVRAVNNPLAASGAADPEDRDTARANAPRTVLTLDRLVSLADYGDFARSFAGVGKARAVDLWDGRARFVHVTVASASGQVFRDDDEVLANLRTAMDACRDPEAVVRVDPHVEVGFGLRAGLIVHPDCRYDDVEVAARAALDGAFDFASREFAHPVSSAEVVTVLQAVDGVVAVDLDALWREDSHRRMYVLPARPARLTPSGLLRAELLVLDPARVNLREVVS